VARTLHVLADWRNRDDDRSADEALLRRAAAIYERSDSDGSAWAVQCFFDLAALLGNRGAFAEAESWLQRGAAITERHFGDRHATDVLRRLARLAFHQGDLIRSEQYSLRAVARELAAIARRKPSEATRLLALAGRLDFATAAGQVALVDSFRAFRDERGLGAYEIGSWLNGLAALARACDRAELAEALLREAVVFHCRIFGHDCPVRLGSLEKLGEVLNERGACVEALTWLREAFEVRSRTDRLDTDAGRALVGLIQQCERVAAGERDR
jgi:tetratricopeptide (TPR) repeat protein